MCEDFPAKDRAETRKHRKIRLEMILSIISIVVGLVLLIYPWVSNYLMQKNSKASGVVYDEQIEEAEDAELKEAWAAARAYNEKVQHSQVELTDPFDPTALTAEDMDTASDYNNVLNLNNDGCMGYIDIPSINVYLPIMHSTSAESLAAGAGHLSGSSLPIGGESSHCVITGHTGLSSAKLFTDLTELEEGDMFYLHILDKILAYQVINIQIVEPTDTEYLRIQDGRDLVTLVTCTPYGINTHRLFVTGERTEYVVETYQAEEAKAADKIVNSVWMRSYCTAIAVGLCIVVVLWIVSVIIRKIIRYKKKSCE